MRTACNLTNFAYDHNEAKYENKIKQELLVEQWERGEERATIEDVDDALVSEELDRLAGLDIEEGKIFEKYGSAWVKSKWEECGCFECNHVKLGDMPGATKTTVPECPKSRLILVDSKK